MNVVIKRPVVSEKSAVSIKNGVYTFVVDTSANKIQVKNAIEAKFGVTVESVNVINRKGKKRRRGRIVGETKSIKIAYVSLKDGQVIESIQGLF